ncbi:30S ribosomal protein S8 [Candidatus Arcanobacter lacustris]|jgi:small subunit ribosomal protein S8|uniref:Small ribosomal subunit protein uS8 n=1 Tax=Candidatus Arcanibacter lacustris TaxID=1607817 RepID=A0A0F5MP11_9RICK|nr:30S ribosomal protein S8 [Candidatus Arcanobacter lacustris]
MLTDSLADMLTRIRNGQRAKLSYVTAPLSRLSADVLEVLKTEGYIREYSTTEIRKNISEIKIELKYNHGIPVIKKIDRVSKPGRRVYSSIANLATYYNGLGISILSTSRGIMSDYDARLANIGGEVLCTVF